MNEKVKMYITMEVSIPQALALQAMFEYWNELSSTGSSRNVSFFVDGDGDFHPKCTISFSGKAIIPMLTPEIKKAVIKGDLNGNRLYDYDGVEWKITTSKRFSVIHQSGGEELGWKDVWGVYDNKALKATDHVVAWFEARTSDPKTAREKATNLCDMLNDFEVKTKCG